MLDDHDNVPQLVEPILAELVPSKSAKFRPLMVRAEWEWLEELGIFAGHGMDTTAASYVKPSSSVPMRLLTAMASEPLESTGPGEDSASSNEGAMQATIVPLVHMVVRHERDCIHEDGVPCEAAKVEPPIVNRAAPEFGPFDEKMDDTTGPSHEKMERDVPTTESTVARTT